MPCLYAIKLSKNTKNAVLYVGESGVHTADCKFSIHTTGDCICGHTENANPFQRSTLAREHGERLFGSKAASEDKATRVAEEEAWARYLAERWNWGVWCNGRLFSR